MKVAILTMFKGLDTTYSLVNVVADQIKMLLDHQIEVSLLVCEGCKRIEGIYSDARIQWVEIDNHIGQEEIIWRDYTEAEGKVHPGFYKEARVVADCYVKALQGVEVCIMHDILFQGWHYIHNVAIRMAQKELEDIRFLAFTHSFPSKRPNRISVDRVARYIDMPHTYFIYPTYSGISALSEQYHIPEGRCKVIYNVMDLIQPLSDAVNKLHKEVNLLETELLVIYPCRMTPSKALEKVAMLAGRIKVKKQRTIKIIYCDFPSLDISSEVYKEQIIEKGTTYGLEKKDMVFTSDYGFPKGFPRKSVLELFSLSNLFICPSFSESFGLTVLEAASRGNFLVLNEKVPALQELGDKLHAYYMSWSARQMEDDFKMEYKIAEKDYYDKHVETIMNQLLQEQALFAKTQVRRFYSSEWIFNNQLAPLLKL